MKRRGSKERVVGRKRNSLVGIALFRGDKVDEVPMEHLGCLVVEVRRLDPLRNIGTFLDTGGLGGG
jgi:hypothetical protein